MKAEVQANSCCRDGILSVLSRPQQHCTEGSKNLTYKTHEALSVQNSYGSGHTDTFAKPEPLTTTVGQDQGCGLPWCTGRTLWRLYKPAAAATPLVKTLS